MDSSGAHLRNVTLALLAGGEGSRMGQPKGDLRVAGVPLAEYLWRRIAWPGRTLLVTAPGRERPPGAARFDREATDPVAGAGPLQGILTALEHATTPLLLVAAVDMPGIGREQLDWLTGQLGGVPDLAGVLCRRHGSIEPLPCAFRTSLALPLVRGGIETGRRSVRSLLERPAFLAADAPAGWDEETWTNLNDPLTFQAFARQAAKP